MSRLYRILCLVVLAAIPAAAVVDSISLPDSIWAGDSVTWVRKVPGYCEGPAYEKATGAVYFSQQPGNSAANWPIYRTVPGVDTGGIWYNTNQSNGMAFDPQGRLVVCQKNQVVRLKPNPVSGGLGGALDTILTSGFGANVQSNDLVIGRAGDIYFSGYTDNNVYYLSPSGVRITVAMSVSSSNGIEWLQDLDSNAVYVNASGSNVVYRYQRDPATGALSNRTNFISSIPAPDGGSFDSHGNRYVASYNNGEIRVYNMAGTYLGRIALRKQSGIYDSVASSGRTGKQGNADNCVFGGPDLKTLYITGDGGLFSIPLKIPGVPAGQVTAIHRGLAPMKSRPNASSEEFRDLRGRMLPKSWDGTAPKFAPSPDNP
ncbi:MAG TPA: SMP-30/gluconolactonase/LRE family protein [Fibrobacteria bacterium]|nr:SMP-30/gluconolactonase/LRE family protein [Fibrobacteria bacterium]